MIVSRLIAALVGLCVLACREAVLPGGPPERPAFDPGPVPPEHAAGAELFLANCAGCHGPAGSGFGGGPPLVDTLYLPDRFADSSIRRAVLRGAPRRHWDFDDMPAVRTVRPHQLPVIVGYLRWVQERWAAAHPDSAARPLPAGEAGKTE